ncbi:MAG: hypothetical protein KGI58_03860 [Patescibacteria group bacterium]|nr:hypothetical protein [Patescibacteria group bacterium]
MIQDDDGRLIIGKGVRLNPYKPRPSIHREYLTENEIRNSTDQDLILDTESYPNLFLAGFKIGSKYCHLQDSFDPFQLCWMLMSYRSVGFNSINYDLPMLWASYVNRDPAFLKEVSDALIFGNERPEEIAKKFNFKIYPLQPRQHIDLINVCPLKGSLKLYGARLHAPRIQELPYPDTKYLEEDEKQIVTQYNCNDLDLTQIIKDFCKERIALREALSIEYSEDLMSKSDAQMAEVVIPKEVAKLNKRYSKRPTIEAGTVYKYSCPHYLQYYTPSLQNLLTKVKRANFIVQANGKIALPDELKTAVKVGNGIYRLGIGGLHSSEECVGYITNNEYKLIDRDMVSYYPNILINLGLYPVALGPNFLIVFKGFKAERVVAKRNKNFTKDKGLKIFINGMSGKLSNVWSKMYSPDLTIQMTVTGQLTLLMLIEMLECNGIQVISANTDGIVIYCKREDEEKLAYWIKYFESLTGFETEETLYRSYYARDVNNYFAVKENVVKIDEGVKVKGAWSEVGSQSGTKLDNNPINLICSDAIKALLHSGIPIEETILKCKDITRFVAVRNVKGGAHKSGEYLGKVIRWVYCKNTYGTINYITTNNKVADTEGAKPFQDLPDTFPFDEIDYDWYINKTREILYDIGYYKKPVQMDFF